MTHALIIDDNTQNIAVLAQLLTMEGVSYTQVSNPARIGTAVATLPSADVVFLDLEMPGADGYQVLEWMKTEPKLANVPIVAYTVHVSEINHASQMGFHSFLGKPLDADKFPDQLARILRGERVWAAQ
jgi:CheY-like chemotaxis protein